MHAPSDSAAIQLAYTRICELTRQRLNLGMILEDLRKEAFSDDVIVAALKERAVMLAGHYRKWAGRLFRIALLLFALGMVAWPVTAIFDFGGLESGAVFAFFATSLFMAGRGVWTRLRARQFDLTDAQARELVANGKISSASTGTRLASRESSLSDPYDNMEEAHAQTVVLKRIQTAVWWSKATVFVLGAFLILSAMAKDQWLAVVLGFPVFAFAVFKIVPAVAIRVAAWVEFGGGSKSPSFTIRDGILLAEVPRLDNLPIPTDDDVIRGEPLSMLHPTATSGGGKASEARGELPPGVVIFTEQGIAFFPNVDSPDKVIKDVASSLLAVAASVTPIAKAASELGLKDALKTEEPPLPFWLRQARKNEHHFVVPWLELVCVRYDPSTGTVYLDREPKDGMKRHFVFRSSTDEWPQALMSLRLKHEVLSVMREFVELPRLREVLPELLEKFREIYGERIDDHWPEIVREAENRVAEQQLGDALEVIARKMVETLPYYGRYPKVRQMHPHFFAEDSEGAGA